MVTTSSLKQQQVEQWQISENPVRSNDGTSSGALAADRLRVARRKAIETTIESFPARRAQKNMLSAEYKSHLLENQQQQPRHAGSTILHINENPIRSNDGTSSGAVVADRLRVARRKAIESAVNTRQEHLHAHQRYVIEEPDDEELVTSILSNTRVTSVYVIENPDRPNDGTSSGALAADRLRKARRKAIESMNTQHHSE